VLSTVIHIAAGGKDYTFVDVSEVSLGRADTADVVFVNPYVSRRHGKLTRTGRGWLYEDLASSRGTRFRGRRITSLLLVGSVTLLLGEPGQGEEVLIELDDPSQLFICYRREDAAGHAGRLRDRLAEVFGDAQVFLDIDQIGIGEDFVARTTSVVNACRVLLVVIGPRWLDVRDARGRRRIDDPDDYVRLEISTALDRHAQIDIIPILVQGAKMPREEDLPAGLQALSRRNALAAPDERWRPEIERLIQRLDGIVGASAPPA
jgi:hypothetical protein